MAMATAPLSDPGLSFEAERRRHLIEATIETVAEVGFRAASLAEIARRAGVSQGLFAHYFGDKDGLLEATLRFMATRLARSTASRMRAARSPLDRVMAVTESALAAEEFDRRTSAVWLAFWGQIMHSEPYRRVQAIYQKRMRSNLRHGLRALLPEERVETAVTLIAATIDGLWLQSHAEDDRSADDVRARDVVRRLVELLVGERREAGPSRAAAPALFAPPAAVRGVPDSAWAELPPGERAEVLRGVAARMRVEAGAIARLEARDAGRPVAEIEARDLPLALRWIERAAERAGWSTEETARIAPRLIGRIERYEAAPIVAAAHRDAPLLTAIRSAAPALARGAAVTIAATACKGLALARIEALFREAGAPDAVTILVGDEASLSLRSAGLKETPPLRGAAVVLGGADLDRAVAAIARGPRLWSIAPALGATPVFVAETIRAALVERLVEAAEALLLGDPLDPGAEVGPLASRERLAEALGRIGQACADGARLAAGGRTAKAGKGRGAFLAPTVLDGCRDAMAIARTGLDGPLIAVFSVEDVAALPARLRALGVNGSLAVFGDDARAIRDLAQAAGARSVRVNDGGERLSAAAEDWLDPWPDDESRTIRTLIHEA